MFDDTRPTRRMHHREKLEEDTAMDFRFVHDSSSYPEYCACRERQGKLVRGVIAGFPFRRNWLDNPEGLRSLVLHCKDRLKEDGTMNGPWLNSFNRLADAIENTMCCSRRSLPWTNFIDKLKAQGHLPHTTPPSSARAFFVTFLFFRIDSRMRSFNPYTVDRNSPWRLLNPYTGDGLVRLEMIFRGI